MTRALRALAIGIAACVAVRVLVCIAMILLPVLIAGFVLTLVAHLLIERGHL